MPSPNIGNLDNDLAGVSAASANDAWAIGTYYPTNSPNVLAAMAEHWDGSSWTEYPLPNVGLNENSLLGVSELPTGKAWAVGCYIDSHWTQRALIEHYDGTTWRVIAAADPGTGGDILYGVSAVADNDVWTVGVQRDAAGNSHALIEHWNGTAWSTAPAVDPNGGGNALYAVSAVTSSNVYAAGQTGTAFPSTQLIEHWDGIKWSQTTSPMDTGQTQTPLGLTATTSTLTSVGDQENSTAPYTTLVASGTASNLALVASPNSGTGENDLFGAATATDGSTYAAGWADNPATGNHVTVLEHGVGGQWSIDTTPNPGTGDNGFAGITAVPGGGLWAVGILTANGNASTLIAFHC